MGTGSSQLDIPNRPLLERPVESVWTDIGEATITHTIFGRAKVRITRRKDRVRRALLLTLLVVTLTAALVWQVLLVSAPDEMGQSVATPLPPAQEVVTPILKETVSHHAASSLPSQKNGAASAVGHVPPVPPLAHSPLAKPVPPTVQVQAASSPAAILPAAQEVVLPVPLVNKKPPETLNNLPGK